MILCGAAFIDQHKSVVPHNRIITLSESTRRMAMETQ